MPKSTANYLTTDALGRVVAQFSGGVVLPLQSQVDPGPNIGTSFAWEDGTGGPKLAYLAATKNALAGATADLTSRVDATEVTLARIRVFTDTLGGGRARVQATARDPDSSATRTIIDSNGQSDFVQGANVHLGAVSVSPAGVLLGTLGVTAVSSRVGVGSYQVTITSWPASAILYPVGSRGGTAGAGAFAVKDSTGPTAGLLEYYMFNTSAAVLQDFDAIIHVMAVF